MTLYEFMSGSPWLTFFLASIAGDVIIKVARALILRKVELNKLHVLKKED